MIKKQIKNQISKDQNDLKAYPKPSLKFKLNSKAHKKCIS